MSIKKAELHVHLEGTISPSLAHILAHRNKLTIPEGLIAPDGKSYLSKDFLHFLKVYDTLAALIKKPEDYYDVTFDYLKQNALEDTLYIEMMYSPDHAEQTTGSPSFESLEAIQQAINDAESKYAIVGRILVTAVRHFGAEACERVAREISKKSLPCVVGFGLGGDEIHFPPRLFSKTFHIAADAGLSCTAHAGEFAPADGIREALKYLPIKRVGHGVQVIHSKETMELLKEKEIALELCPSSNIKLGLFSAIENHPFHELANYGIQVSINSDDPPFMSTSLAEEYNLVQNTFGYTDEMMSNFTRMAISNAFVDEPTKQKLLARI